MTNIEIRGLMNLTLVPMKQTIQRWLLRRKIEGLYRHREYFRKQANNGNYGLRLTDTAIVRAEVALRDLER